MLSSWKGILKGKIKYLFILLLILSALEGAFGKDTIIQKQEELKNIKKRLEVQKTLIEKTKSKERNLVREINIIDQEIEITSNRIEELETHLNKILILKKEAERRLNIAEKNLKASRSRLGEKLFLIYRYGNAEYLELLLGASDPYDFLTRYRFLSQLAKEDALLIRSIQDEMTNVDRWRKELNEKERDIRATRKELLSRQNFLADKKEERNRLLAQTISERAAYERALKELEESSKALEALIRRLQQTTQGPGLSGNLYWPTTNRLITSTFGYRIHPIWRIRMFHSGIDISGSYGDPIYAVNYGRVIYSGWQSGYGKVIIIDHGNGMSTLYAHCSVLIVGEGEQVKKGQLIGKIGSTGWSTGSHLHFEIRRNGIPINPLSMVK